MKTIILTIYVAISVVLSCRSPGSSIFELLNEGKKPITESNPQLEKISGDYGETNIKISTQEPRVSQGLFNNKIEIYWDNISNAKYCAIYRVKGETRLNSQTDKIEPFIPDSEFPARIAEVLATNRNFTDSLCQPNTIYFYAIKGVSEDKTSEGQPSYFYLGYRLSPPTMIMAENKDSKQKIGISWDQSFGAESYKVYRAKSSPESEYLLIGESATTYFEDHRLSNTPPKPGQKYYYKIKSVKNLSIESSLSNHSNSGEIVSEYACAPPELVTASRAESADSIIVAWDESENAERYCIYRATDPNNLFSKLSETNENFFIDSEIEHGRNYFYQVAAINSANLEGTKSKLIIFPEADADLCISPSQGYSLGKVDKLLVLESSLGQIFFYWEKVKKADYYAIFSQDRDGETIEIANFLSDTRFSTSNSELSENKFFIKACREIGNQTICSADYLITEACSPLPSEITTSDSLFELTEDGRIISKNIIKWEDLGFIKYNILKKEYATDNFERIGSALINGLFVDLNFEPRSYDFFQELIPQIASTVEDRRTSLKHALSAEYKIEVILDEEQEIIETSPAFSAFMMPTFEEIFYIMQFAQDCATNKMTNKSVFSGLYPKGESDPGILSGEIKFSFIPDGIQRCGNVVFELNNYSDWPGIILKNSYKEQYFENAQAPITNSRVNNIHSDTLQMSGLFHVSRRANLKLNPDNTVANGTVTLEVLNVGTYTITVTDENNIYNTFQITDRCPGGRNATIGGIVADGHTQRYDQTTLSKFAVFEIRGINTSEMTIRE
ncbi:MAG: hypothetical protein JXR63_11120 [Spirochaetales bacterium]|nr:hypothetical protein [Spirochaetales bacterium]